MGLGKRKQEQQEAWVSTIDLPKSPGHPFYRKLNRLLAEAGFEVLECYGWFDRRPFAGGEDSVWIAGRK